MNITPPTYPARPTDGGPFDKAPAKSGDWTYEPKYNGWRALIHIETGAMFNRHGQRLSIEDEFRPALKLLRTTLDCQAFKWADCEALERRHDIGRGTLIVLDVIPDKRNPVTSDHFSYEQRRSWLQGLVPVLAEVSRLGDIKDNTLYQSPGFLPEHAGAWWAMLQLFNHHAGCPFYEGMVAKRNDSRYPIQLRTPDEKFPYWVKHRWAF